MALTSLEIIALILIVISTIKILVLLVNAKKWINFSKWVYGGGTLSMIVLLALAAFIFYYLIQELTIVQILAVTLFVSLFIGVGFVSYSKELLEWYEKKIKTKSLWGNGVWFYTLLWIVLLVWGLVEIF